MKTKSNALTGLKIINEFINRGKKQYAMKNMILPMVLN